MRSVNLLVIGAGDYVCGRGGSGYGTVLPALAESKRDGLVERVVVAASTAAGVAPLRDKLSEINAALGTTLAVEVTPDKGSDPQAFLAAIAARPAPDAAIIVTPDRLHAVHARTVLESGLHCLVVKPLTETVSDALALVQQAESRGLYGAVEFHKRWDESNLVAKAAIREKQIGDLLSVLVEYSQKKSVPSESFRSWSGTSNVFQYLGVHYADIIYFVTGARPIRASAIGRKSWLKNMGIDTWDAVDAMVEWIELSGRRFTSVFALNWIEPAASPTPSRQKISFVGTSGRIDCDQGRRGVEMTTDKNGTTVPNPYFSRFLPDPDGASRFRGYGYRSIRQFVEDVAAIKSGTAVRGDFEGRRPTFRDALPSTSVVEAVNRSLQSNGDWIDIPAVPAESAATA